MAHLGDPKHAARRARAVAINASDLCASERGSAVWPPDINFKRLLLAQSSVHIKEKIIPNDDLCH
jgi:hypothetical protein